jgi:hypothetical protein
MQSGRGTMTSGDHVPYRREPEVVGLIVQVVFVETKAT